MTPDNKRLVKERARKYSKNAGYGILIAALGTGGSEIKDLAKDYFAQKKENKRIELLEKSSANKDIKIAKLEEAVSGMKDEFKNTNDNIRVLIGKL